MPAALRCDVLVLGGGPAGLAATWELARGGASVLLLEREEATGGLCRTHEREGWRFDMGGHRFITADRDLLERVLRLCGDELLLAERRSEVHLLGRSFRYPLELPDLLAKLPPGLAARALLSWMKARIAPKARIRNAGEPEGFEAWAVERFGRVLYDLFIGPYTEKVWGVPARELSSEWAAQRISLLGLGELLHRLVRPRAEPTPRTCARSFLYPRLGMGRIFQRMRQAAEAAGARVWTGATALELERSGDRVAAVRVRSPAGEVRVEPGHLLSTIPLPALLDLACGPEALLAERAALTFRPVRFLNLALAREQVLPVTWRYVGEARLRAGRLQEPRRRSPAMAPAGCSSLMVEVPHAPGDEVDRADDAELLARLRPELLELGVELGSDLRFAFSVRAPEAYPVHLRATQRARAAALSAVDRLANLRTFGRQGAFRFVFSDAAMRMGLLAAEGVLAGRLPASDELARVQSARELVEVRSLVG